MTPRTRKLRNSGERHQAVQRGSSLPPARPPLVAVLLALALAGCDGPAAGPPAKPPVTDAVHVTVRPSALDPTRGVLQLRSARRERLDGLRLRFYDPASREDRTFAVSLAPAEAKEFGWLEGWDLKAGQDVTLTHNGFAPAAFDVFAGPDGSLGLEPSRRMAEYRQLEAAVNAADRERRTRAVVGWIIAGILVAGGALSALRERRATRARQRQRERGSRSDGVPSSDAFASPDTAEGNDQA